MPAWPAVHSRGGPLPSLSAPPGTVGGMRLPSRASHPPSRRRRGVGHAVRVLVLALPLLARLTLGAGGAAAAPTPTGVWPLWPVPVVVEGFHPPESPYGAGHRGVDLLGAPGRQVRAAMAGTVSFAGVVAGRGVVVVDHGATRTTYQPVAATVPVGRRVPAGAPVGRLLLPGSHCFPRSCLHWGWIRDADDVYLDPLLLVGAGPVRLLPLWRDLPARDVGVPYARGCACW